MIPDQPSPADNIRSLYERHAPAFARQRGQSLVERTWLDRFRAAASGGKMLDLGCGFGEPVARYLIAHGAHVTGVDSSPSFIAMCHQRFPEHRWEVGDMRQLALGERFDGILAWDSFFHLTADDQRRMFPIFARHARPGAALIFNSGTTAGEAMGEFEGEVLYHASLDTAEYESLLRANGFAMLAHVVDDASCGGRTVWLAQQRY